MRENEDLTKYLYAENGDIERDGIRNMNLEDTQHWYKEHIEINENLISQHKSDEMYNMLGIGTIRNSDGEIIKFYNLEDNTLIQKLSECTIAGLENAPKSARKYYENRENEKYRYYIPKKNMFLWSMGYTGDAGYTSLNVIDGYNWTVLVHYPSNGFRYNDGSSYFNERRYFYLYISDAKTGKTQTMLKVYLNYHDLYVFSNDVPECCKIIKFEIRDSEDKEIKEIVCRFIADTFIVTVDDNKLLINSVDELERIVISELIESNNKLNKNIFDDPNSFEILFNEINSYINRDFRTEKDHERNFINGHKPTR